jgi:dTMP kinase
MKREYLKKKKDVHEADVDFLKNSIKSALWLAEKEKNWTKIDCAKDKGIRTREDIHTEVYEKVKKVLK